MSLHKVPYTTILEIKNHPNAHSLSIATVYGFQVVVQKDRYKKGDRVLFVPPDSVLPQWLEDGLFPPSAKIKLTKHRIRQIRIRGFPSQGMLIDGKDPVLKNRVVLGEIGDTRALEFDFAEALGIVKYEPPAQKENTGPKPRNKPKENPRFHKYNGIDNIKWYPTLFKADEEVVVQEKLHGSNCRAAIQPTPTNTLWRKFLNLVGLLPKYEFVWGSNNVQLHRRPDFEGYYGRDVYSDVLEKVDAKTKLKPGETIYGELIGPGVQKGYDYGLTEHHFVLFDVKTTLEDGTQVYLNPEECEAYAVDRGFDFVPVLYRGPYVRELIEPLVSGPSVYYPKEPVREGIVIKSRLDYHEPNFGGKKVLKWISPIYLDNPENTDNH